MLVVFFLGVAVVIARVAVVVCSEEETMQRAA